MTRRPWLSTLAGVALALLAPLALPARADVPPALDRVPAGAPVVVVITHVDQFMTGVTETMSAFGLPADEMMGLDKFKAILKTPGVNASGSAALVIASDKDDEKGPRVVIAPVSDFAAVVKALGGEAGPGVRELKLEDKTFFAKDLSGGFAAVSTDKAAVELFEGKPGSGPGYEKVMGTAGRAVAQATNVFVVMDLQSNAEAVSKTLEGMKGQLQLAAAMSGGKADMTKMSEALDTVKRDGAAVVLGLKKSESGLRFDSVLQFKEGSETAGKLNSPGKVGSLTGALPNQPFLLAASMDASSPAVQNFFKSMVEMSKKSGGPDFFGGMNPMASIEKMQGFAFFLGTPPSMTNGLLLNTAAYVKTSDPAGYIAMMKDMLGQMNGKQIEGITYQSSFEAGGGKAGDKTVDLFSVKFQVDENNPGADQIRMVQSALFGTGGITGFVAPAPGGVVVTYSKNTTLLQAALAAAGDQKGLGADKGVRTVTENLPSERVGEAFIGTKSILETVTAFMGQFNFKVPEDLPPIGLSLTTAGGGARVTAFAPQSVIETLSRLKKLQEGEGDEDAEKKPPAKEKTGQPKF